MRWYAKDSSGTWDSTDQTYTMNVGGSAALTPATPTIHLAAMGHPGQAKPSGQSPVHLLEWKESTFTPTTRIGGGPLSLRFGLSQESEAPTNPLVHLTSHGSASSTTISPVAGSVLSGTTVTFSWSYTGGSGNGPDVAYKYTGKELDGSTDLYFYEARYYDAALGRFISADTIVPSATDPQSLNRYAYAANNPVLYNDPSGHCPICVGIAVGAVIGGVSAGIQSDWDFDAIAQGVLIGGISGAISSGAYPASYASLIHGAGWTTTNALIGAGLNSGAIGFATSFVGGQIARSDNLGLALGASLAGGLVNGGFNAGGFHLSGGQTWGRDLGGIVSAPAVGAVSAAIRGEDPGAGALNGLLRAAVTIGARFIFIDLPFPGNWLKEGRFSTAKEYHEYLAQNSRYDIGKDGVTLALQGPKTLNKSLVVDIHLSETNRNGIDWVTLGLRAVYPEHTYFGTFTVPPYDRIVTITIPYGDWNYGKVFIVPYDFDAGRGQNPFAHHIGGGTLIFCSGYPCD